MTRIGSLCSGYEGLGMATQAVLGGDVAWFAEIEPAACKVLAHHWPDVPNHGDIRTCDWSAVASIDVLVEGFPCQPASAAGKQLGMADERWLWDAVRDAIGALRPALTIVENVRGLLTVDRGLAFGRVVGDLAELGYDATWGVVRASDAGAAHERARVYLAAADARRLPGQPGRFAEPGEAAAGRALRVVAGRDGTSSADPTGDGRNEGRAEPAGLRGGPDAALGGGAPASDAHGHAVRVQPVREPGSSEAAVAGRDRSAPAPDPDDAEQPRQHAQQPWRAAAAGHRGACDPDCTRDWLWVDEDGRDYGPAVRRWHDLTRCVPRPTAPRRSGAERLNPAFSEWHMGLPAGHVTGVPGISVNEQLKLIGNGVVPQQAELALRLLLPRLAEIRGAA